MPAHDAEKERPTRIPLEDHQRPAWVQVYKERLGLIALVLSLSWVAIEVSRWTNDRWPEASRGPVAAVHQTWNLQCSACHEAFTPISSHAWAAPFLGDPAVSSQKCQACHEGAAHHAHQQPDLTCGSCHREHQGKEKSLVNLPDSDCTQCHRDLLNHGVYDFLPAQALLSIRRFAEDTHPKFRSIISDPGKLKFNHLLHLTPGMALGKEGGPILTLQRIPEPRRERYRRQQENKADDAAVQLQCASCHQLDAGKREAGAYMLPIVYENQCQACHPLTLPGKLTIPHRLAAREIHDLVANYFTAEEVRGMPGLLDRPLLPPLPGKLPQNLLPTTARAEIKKKTAQADKILYQGKQACALCHYFAADKEVAATQVPAVWLRHAKFNHTAHRAVSCAECHPHATTSTSEKDVLIPDRDNCVQCHAPAARGSTPVARFNCTECHRYHHGAAPLQGVGAAQGQPRKRRGIQQFLSGE